MITNVVNGVTLMRALRDHQLDDIKTLSMDMNMACISAARIHQNRSDAGLRG